VAAWEASEILVQIRTPKCVASGDVQCRARHERGHARGSRKVLRRQEKRSTILVRDSSDYGLSHATLPKYVTVARS
jgi:hypothetical protein